ncbi:MAG: hypothetical protein LRY73_04190 [Bacillus sp. (in: Bacteria)]|nr:hypothetical protein [Bacillus sp. (in: firmicutes)]
MSEQPEVNNELVEEVKEEQQKLSYFQYVKQIFKNPSAIFNEDFKGYDLFGIINLMALAVLLFGSIFVQRVIMFSGTAWFSWGFSGAVRQSIAYMVPLAIVLFLFHWYATKEGNKQKISFFFEKVGAAILIPCVFLLLSIPFNLLDITIHS